jgi:hypothetical protein
LAASFGGELFSLDAPPASDKNEKTTKNHGTVRVMGNWQAWNNRLTRCLAAWIALGCFSAAGQDASGKKVGPAFRRELENSVTVAWSQRTLREVIASLTKTVGIAVFLDRRIDGEQNIELEVREQSLQVLLLKLAGQAKAGTTTVDPVVYLGPAETAAKLATLAALRRQEAAQLPSPAKTKLLRGQPWKWEELSEPRNLLADLAQQASVTVENAEIIPHDLWPAVSLPPLPWVDRLSLFLAGFGLTFEITGRGNSVRLVEMPVAAVLEKSYTPRSLPEATAAQLRKTVPDAKIRVEQGKLVVAGSQEDHDKIERLLAGQSVRTAKTTQGGPDDKRFTGTIENKPAGAVVRDVATQLGKEVKFDTTVLPKLKENVNLTVKGVTPEELLTRALKPLGLTFKITADAIEIVPAM